MVGEEEGDAKTDGSKMLFLPTLVFGGCSSGDVGAVEVATSSEEDSVRPPMAFTWREELSDDDRPDTFAVPCGREDDRLRGVNERMSSSSFSLSLSGRAFCRGEPRIPPSRRLRERGETGAFLV